MTPAGRAVAGVTIAGALAGRPVAAATVSSSAAPRDSGTKTTSGSKGWRIKACKSNVGGTMGLTRGRWSLPHASKSPRWHVPRCIDAMLMAVLPRGAAAHWKKRSVNAKQERDRRRHICAVWTRSVTLSTVGESCSAEMVREAHSREDSAAKPGS